MSKLQFKPIRTSVVLMATGAIVLASICAFVGMESVSAAIGGGLVGKIGDIIQLEKEAIDN